MEVPCRGELATVQTGAEAKTQKTQVMVVHRDCGREKRVHRVCVGGGSMGSFDQCVRDSS